MIPQKIVTAAGIRSSEKDEDLNSLPTCCPLFSGSNLFCHRHFQCCFVPQKQPLQNEAEQSNVPHLIHNQMEFLKPFFQSVLSNLIYLQIFHTGQHTYKSV